MTKGIAYKQRLRPGERKILEALRKEQGSFTQLKQTTKLCMHARPASMRTALKGLIKKIMCGV